MDGTRSEMEHSVTFEIDEKRLAAKVEAVASAAVTPQRSEKSEKSANQRVRRKMRSSSRRVSAMLNVDG